MVARSFSSSNKSNSSYSTHIFSDRAVQIITNSSLKEKETAVERPWFIYLAYQATHAPLQAPAEVIASFPHIKDRRRQTFAAMAAVVDEGLGNITAVLMRTGQYSNTVIFLSGDNGGTVREGGSNWPLRGFKGSLWEGGMRQSALVHSALLPARADAENSNLPTLWHGLFHVSDWMPTTLEIAGGLVVVKHAHALDGYSMWQALMSLNSRAGPNSTAESQSPRKELLHEIDRISHLHFQCSGPNPFPADGNGSGGWDMRPVKGRYVRAALHTVVNGTHWKVVVGECAGWDTNSLNIP